MNSYTRDFGGYGEKLGATHLKEQGYQILIKNYRTKYGEIDIIATKNNCIYFFEVKTRSSDRYGKPYEAVNFNKIEHIKRAAYHYLLQKNVKNSKLKIGIISILKEKGKEKISIYELFF